LRWGSPLAALQQAHVLLGGHRLAGAWLMLGAMITSTNWRATMAAAVSPSSSRLKAMMPPKAEVGSVW
jgi:hypothetical protein